MIDAAASIERLRARNPQAAELAKLASLAVQVEPELLRALRMLIPEADGGAEADVWLSELVDAASPLAMRFVPAVRARLQELLRDDAAALECAAATTARMHADVSEVVRIEEAVTLHALRGGPDAEANIGELLAPVIRRLEEQPHEGLARWAIRTLAEMSPAVHQTRPAWELMRASSVARAGGTGGTVEDLPRSTVYLRLRLDALEIHTSEVAPAQTLAVPRTDPMVVEVSWREGSVRKTARLPFMPGDSLEQPLDPREVTVRTLAGDIVKLAPQVEVDDWAVVNRDHPEFLAWLSSSTGGRVPRSHIFVGGALRNRLGDRPVRRFYLYVENDFAAPELTTATMVIDGHGDLTHEAVIIVNGFMNVQVTERPDRLMMVMHADGVRPTLLAEFVAGLEGAAADSAGDVTSVQLARYIGTKASVDVEVTAGFVLCSVPLTTVGMLFPSSFAGAQLTIAGPVERLVTAGSSIDVLLPPGEYTIERREVQWKRPFTVTPPATTVDFRWKFNGHWVIVAGTGTTFQRPTKNERAMIDPLAHALVDGGYGLIGGGWPGIDDEIAHAFAEKVRLLDGNPDEVIRQYVNPGFTPVYDGGTVIEAEDNEDEPLALATAMIVIGGRGGTLDYARHAGVRGVPVFPIAGTGGAARELLSPKREKFTAAEARAKAYEVVARIDDIVASPHLRSRDRPLDFVVTTHRAAGNDAAVVFTHNRRNDLGTTWGDLPQFLARHRALFAYDMYSLGDLRSQSIGRTLGGLMGGGMRFDQRRMAVSLRESLGYDPILRHYPRLVLIAHGVDGLVVQHALIEDAALVARTESVVLCATPSSGVPKSASPVLWDVAPLADIEEGSETITQLRARWSERFGPLPPFPMLVITGNRDSWTPASSADAFPAAHILTLPGDHNSLVKPEAPDSPIVQLIAEQVKNAALQPALQLDRDERTVARLIPRTDLNREQLGELARALAKLNRGGVVLERLRSRGAEHRMARLLLAAFLQLPEDKTKPFVDESAALLGESFTRALRLDRRQDAIEYGLSLAFVEATRHVRKAKVLAQVEDLCHRERAQSYLLMAAEGLAALIPGDAEKALDLYRKAIAAAPTRRDAANIALEAVLITSILHSDAIALRFERLLEDT